MFQPEDMLYARIWLLDEDSNEVTRVLAREGSLHVVDQHEAPETSGPDHAAIGEGSAEEYALQANTAEALLRRIRCQATETDFEVRESILSSDSAEILERSRTSLRDLRREIDGQFARREELESAIARLDAVSEEMHLLAECGLSFDELSGFRFLHVAHGVVDRAALVSLRRRIGPYAHYLRTRPLGRHLTSILLLGDRAHADGFRASLAEAGFRHHEIPERYRQSLEEGLLLVEAELWELRDGLADLNRSFTQSREGWQARLSYWRVALEIHGLLVRTGQKFGSMGRMTTICGFLPSSKRGSLLSSLQDRTPDRYYAEFRDAEGAGAKVPTRLKNSSLFRPFELFIRMYGLPGYRDIDPTPFLAVTFLAMFGMMFGDVGHGAVLALMGLGIATLPYRMLVGMRSLGWVLLGAGASGMVFGFLFGSVFGIEDDSVLPALWIRPSHQEHLPTFLLSAMGLGVAIISLGIALSILQSVQQKKAHKALVGQWSVASLIFYWMLVALLVGWGTGREVQLSTLWLAVVLATPLVLVVVGQMLYHAVWGRHSGSEFDAATVFFEPVEITMGLFTNTVSFLRVGAFGLAHAALTMATFVIMDILPAGHADILTLAIEHLFIIVLEGLIVTIQCLRLEFYEFFSKFYHGDGVAYTPVSIKRE